jgi:hypothetical protein
LHDAHGTVVPPHEYADGLENALTRTQAPASFNMKLQSVLNGVRVLFSDALFVCDLHT